MEFTVIIHPNFSSVSCQIKVFWAYLIWITLLPSFHLPNRSWALFFIWKVYYFLFSIQCLYPGQCFITFPSNLSYRALPELWNLSGHCSSCLLILLVKTWDGSLVAKKKVTFLVLDSLCWIPKSSSAPALQRSPLGLSLAQPPVQCPAGHSGCSQQWQETHYLTGKLFLYINSWNLWIALAFTVSCLTSCKCHTWFFVVTCIK